MAEARQVFPQEKAFLHLDKYFYVPGEQLWFKTYLVEQATHLPSPLSQVLYVELWNEAGETLESLSLRIEAGRGHGHCYLDKAYPPGKYVLRTYTHWMRNTQQAVHQPFEILGPLDSLPPTPSQQKPDLQFLPEGGRWVADLPARLGFKALGPDGLGMEMQGVILNEAEEIITGFETSHRGMGAVAFTPKKNQRYTARVQVGERLIDYPLPGVANSGYVMQVQPGIMHHEVSVWGKEVNPAALFLVGQIDGRPVLSLKVKLDATGKAEVAIPNYKIPTGVMRLSLLTERGRPLCERQFFVRGKDQMQLSLNLPQSPYGKRAAVDLDLTALDPGGKGTAGDFSVAVVHENAFPSGGSPQHHIGSNCYLQAAVKGHIEDPGYYFDPEQKERDAHLDLLLLTQGWRSFDWSSTLRGRQPSPDFLIEKGLSLSGQLLFPAQQPLALGKVNVMIDEAWNVTATEADEDGRFEVSGLHFYDTSLVLIQAFNKRNRSRAIQIVLDSLPPYELDKKAWYGPASSNESDQALLAQRNQQVELEELQTETFAFEAEEVQIEAQRREETEIKDENAIYHTADATFDGDDPRIIGQQNVIEAIRGRVAGMQVQGGPGNYSILIRGASSILLNSPPVYLLNGMVTSIGVLESIPINEIARIDVIKNSSAAMYGSRGAGGAIAVYTKEGSELEQKDGPGTLRPELKGYHIPRKFYAPRYDRAETRTDLPDLRHTLHWEPMWMTDQKGQANLRFFTGDIPGRYRILVQGISAQGEIGWTESALVVE